MTIRTRPIITAATILGIIVLTIVGIAILAAILIIIAAAVTPVLAIRTTARYARVIVLQTKKEKIIISIYKFVIRNNEFEVNSLRIIYKDNFHITVI